MSYELAICSVKFKLVLNICQIFFLLCFFFLPPFLTIKHSSIGAWGEKMANLLKRCRRERGNKVTRLLLDRFHEIVHL